MSREKLAGIRCQSCWAVLSWGNWDGTHRDNCPTRHKHVFKWKTPTHMECYCGAGKRVIA